MKIPKPTVKRLAIYYRCLERLVDKGIDNISSRQLAEMLHIKDTQVRKDLSYFGNFGRRGFGYKTRVLLDEIRKILGIHKRWNVIIVGAGNIGKAIARFKQIEKHNFKITGIFDVDRKKIGKRINSDLIVMSVDEMENFIEKTGSELAVIATPAEAAQLIADRLKNSGIKGIICFAPVTLNTDIPVEYVDITIFFKTLVHSVISLSHNI
ncbi:MULTISPECIES: redox-sensing transcriptional repressor Rex [Pseudothermotoga]|jgi:redox-sensing transcriptional repressor|uniref:Redox-sensing transcriptional repressor Rex n=1 Tax=Pseudothermotoga lettingae (strain ATCC BAA-301 / DSM 14385 / NBRC 107922 / TMO) TaxID=416591 RepID=A8F416_PSELT|nr:MULTISPECIES: redox-sensing transcriptional repressor Rex [Pseudothermotoga]ABV32900.1 CoA-binding domain protein [Pseudothermotoga lettingae TMO]KUK21811.1 MAG: Redox-sensing transcriptional repressor rex [Pseudothermotoga lettingae]MDI3494034.1 redox-sensing transcriptional repressor [Pseudothermotoga sp.]MDK2884950.1 redox-sensing transcriptional repressor [Pseudothermotoga sp.]GLI48101.1 redox-sensing transcriptional repressor Rex 1 [Pseudothermotoga lettingae TMO]